MNWSWRIGRVAGIDIFMHWTFLLLLAWIGGSYLFAGEGWPAAVQGVLFVLAVFGCVVLHEFGHALTARRFGIPTRDVTLYPIGGVARLERMPEKPSQELLVALAGPAVNVVIAGVLLAGLLIFEGPRVLFRGPSVDHFFANLMLVNVILVVFNLLPAFPMDGGRVLRALLAMNFSYVRATRYAARVGQFMALAFAAAGLLLPNGFMLLFIAAFVFLGAEAEARSVQTRSLMQGVRVRDAMMTRFRTLSPNDPLQLAANELLAGAQQDFPVVDSSGLHGILQRRDLVEGLKTHGPDALVASSMTPLHEAVAEIDPLDAAIDLMRDQHCSSMPVLRDGHVVGVLTLENVGELMMLQAAGPRPAPRPPRDIHQAA